MYKCLLAVDPIIPARYTAWTNPSLDDHHPQPVVGPAVGDASFDAYYFTHGCGRPYQRDEHWTRFFGAIADHLVSSIQPRRVLDAGCALGLLVEALRDRGVDAEGIDLSSYAIANIHAPIKTVLPARIDRRRVSRPLRSDRVDRGGRAHARPGG